MLDELFGEALAAVQTMTMNPLSEDAPETDMLRFGLAGITSMIPVRMAGAVAAVVSLSQALHLHARVPQQGTELTPNRVIDGDLLLAHASVLACNAGLPEALFVARLVQRCEIDVLLNSSNASTRPILYSGCAQIVRTTADAIGFANYSRRSDEAIDAEVRVLFAESCYGSR